jgi:hypothetical protein
MSLNPKILKTILERKISHTQSSHVGRYLHSGEGSNPTLTPLGGFAEKLKLNPKQLYGLAVRIA